MADNPELAAYIARMEKISQVANPALIARLCDRANIQQGLVTSRPVALTLDPAAMGVVEPTERSQVGAPVEYPVPRDVADGMESSVPQAVLRDLHRPVSTFRPRVERLETVADPFGEELRAQVAGWVATRFSLQRDPAQSAWADGTRAMAELRATLARPWADSKPDKPTQRRYFPTAEDLRWFAAADDPD